MRIKLRERTLARHPNGRGTVITFDMFGKATTLFVADARYRGVSDWGVYSVCVAQQRRRNPKFYLNPCDHTDNPKHGLDYVLSDIALQTKFTNFKSAASSEELTSRLVERKISAALVCQELGGKVQDGTLFGLPNLYECAVIYLEADRLDELDPTLRDCKRFALGSANPRGRQDIWSCEEYDRYSALCVTKFGFVKNLDKSCQGILIPVKEMVEI